MREIVINNEVIKTQDYIRSDDKYKCYVTVIWHKWGLDHNDDSNVILYPDVTYHIPTTEKWETTTLNHGKFLIKWLKQHTNYNISFNLDHYSYVYKELKKELEKWGRETETINSIRTKKGFAPLSDLQDIILDKEKIVKNK